MYLLLLYNFYSILDQYDKARSGPDEKLDLSTTTTKINEYNNNIERIRLVNGEKVFVSSFAKYFAKNNVYNNLKEIELSCVWLNIRESFVDDDIISPQGIEKCDMILQTIIPLSQADYELHERLKKEITIQIKEKKTKWEIEKMKNDIKQEIELKYNKFDENALSYDYDDNKHKNKHTNPKWCSNIEFLKIDTCQSGSVSALFIDRYIKPQLTSQRIQNSLGNLKAFQFIGHCGYDRSVFDMIGIALLNNISNQLLSLHIEDEVVSLFSKWKFCQEMDKLLQTPASKSEISGNFQHDHIDGKKLKELQDQSWYPVNVEEICLVDSLDCNSVRSQPRFWHEYLNNKLFPYLRHLSISNSLDVTTVKMFHKCQIVNDTCKNMSIINNISSLIKNGLQSLQLKIRNIEYGDLSPDFRLSSRFENGEDERDALDPIAIINFLCCVFDSINHINDINDDDEEIDVDKPKTFILKLEMGFGPFFIKTYFDDFEDETQGTQSLFTSAMKSVDVKRKLSDLFTRVSQLFTLINGKFSDDVMFGFKVKFNVRGDKNRDTGYCASSVYRIIKGVIDGVDMANVLTSNESKIVDVNVFNDGTSFADEDCNEKCVMAALVFKNCSNDESKNLCRFSYVEPKFTYSCSECETCQWLTTTW